MRRRLFLFAVPVLATGLLSACGGPDAVKAEALLQQARQAQQSVTSERFIMKLGIDAEGRSVQIDMDGGGYLRGERAGDFYFSMTGVLSTGTAPLDMVVVRQGQQVRLRSNGRTETLPLPQAQAQLGGMGDLSSFTDLARYVKDVSVSSADYQGRPADKVVGTLDTQALLAGTGGLSSQLLSGLGVKAGDVRVVLFIPRDTHVVEAMIGDFTISAQGHSVQLNISLGVTSLNQPVDFPSV